MCVCMFQRRAALQHSAGSIQSLTPVFPTVWRKLFRVHMCVCACVNMKEEEECMSAGQKVSETEVQHKEQRSIVHLRPSRPHAVCTQPKEKS